MVPKPMLIDSSSPAHAETLETTSKKRLKAAIIFKTIGEFGSRILAFAFVTLMSRKLGPAGWGYWFTAQATIAYLGVLIAPGFSTVMMQKLAARDSEKKEPKFQSNAIDSMPAAVG